MSELSPFNFRRSRGLVWVCDVAGSTSYLNGDEVGSLEEYLPRLHWAAHVFARHAGCEFVKWTGDGFLAWFPISLDRELPQRSTLIFEMVFLLSALNSFGQFGVESKDKPFTLRHAVTYEPDGLLYDIPDHQTSNELLGRDVSLAFRLAGIWSPCFPWCHTQRRIVDRLDTQAPIAFEHWQPDQEQVLRYFKGETYGTQELLRSFDFGWSIADADLRATAQMVLDERSEDYNSLHDAFANGPSWAQAAIEAAKAFMDRSYRIMERLKAGELSPELLMEGAHLLHELEGKPRVPGK